MGYKLLGFAVWKGGSWYLRRRVTGARSAAVSPKAKVFIAGGVVAVIGVALAWVTGAGGGFSGRDE